MNKFDRLYLSLILGAIPPIIFSLAGWWLSLPFLSNDKDFIFFLVGGFAVGLILDFIFLGRFVSRAYEFPPAVLVSIYIFYSICIFGFFMGVPVFNILMGVIAGVYIIRRAANKEVSNNKRTGNKGNGNPGIYSTDIRSTVRKTSLFTTIIIFFFSIAAAVLALRDPYTAANLEGMFNLSFELTDSMIIGLVLIGGLLLLIMQYILTQLTCSFVLKRSNF